jgi:hypothetical protein
MEDSQFDKRRAEMRAESLAMWTARDAEDQAWKNSDAGVRYHEAIYLTLNECARHESSTTLAVARESFGDFFETDDLACAEEISERLGLSIETVYEHKQKIADIFTRVQNGRHFGHLSPMDRILRRVNPRMFQRRIASGIKADLVNRTRNLEKETRKAWNR